MNIYIILAILIILFLFTYNTDSVYTQARKYQELRGNNEIQNNYYFNKAERLYYKEIQNGIDTGKIRKVARAYKNLGNLYRNGIPDKYIRGKKIIGVDRNLDKAVECYNNAYRYGSVDALITLADMYHYDFIEDYYQEGASEKAKDLYNYILEIGNVYQKAIANQRLSQMLENSRNDLTPFLTGYGMDGFELMPHNLTTPTPTNRDTVNPREFINQIRIENGNRNGNRNVTELIDNNPQNVHDNGVTNSVKESIKKLKLTTDRFFNVTDALNQITEFINRNVSLSNQQKDDAFKTLNTIANSNGVLSGTNDTEADALSLVWNRIHNDINTENRENLKNNLVNELIEAVEHGNVVCSRGRFNRIIDSLNAVDPDVNIRPQWAYKQEMISKANVIRQDMIDKLSITDKKAVENPDPTPEQEEICDEFNKKYKTSVINTLKKDYVESGLLDENILKAEINSWIDSI